MNWLNRQTIIGIVVTIGLIGAGIWYQQQTSRASAGEDADSKGSVVLQPVSVMEIRQTDSAIMPQRYTATVVARRTSTLSFQASEKIEEIKVDEGDYVEEGQVLALQDNSVLEAQFKAARARQKQTQAILDELVKGPRSQTIKSANAEYLRLKAQAKLADADFKRQEKLIRTNASSKQEYDAAKFSAEAAKAAAAAAKQRLDEREEQIRAQRGALAIIDATVTQTETRLNQAKLIAPFPGHISRRFVDEGSLPQRGAPILEIVETGNLEVRFGVSPEIARRLKSGDLISFFTGKTGDEIHGGTVVQVQPKLDRATRTQQVIVSVNDSAGSGLVDGQTVTVEFATQSDQPGFWIPTGALQPQVRGLWSVLVANGSPGNAEVSYDVESERRDVEVLATWGPWSRVEGTLEESDRVIIEGGSRVSAGQVVSASMKELKFPWQNESTIQLGELTRRNSQ